jgi:CRISPR/Cas system-associated exonuclease Cas4 (RecB family)
MAKRNYQNDYPSVTGILDVLRKIGLEWWFKVNTPQFIEEKSRKGKEIGTQIHEVIQSFIETGKAKVETQYAEEVSTALKSFMLFRKENPSIVMNKSEIALTSEQHKFNGTIDCMGNNVLIDWKTGEAKKEEKPKIYDEYKYQVAAYVYLWNEVKKENIEKAIIVAVAKDKVAYNIHEMDRKEIDECFNEVFLSALKIKNYQNRKE